MTMKTLILAAAVAVAGATGALAQTTDAMKSDKMATGDAMKSDHMSSDKMAMSGKKMTAAERKKHDAMVKHDAMMKHDAMKSDASKPN